MGIRKIEAVIEEARKLRNLGDISRAVVVVSGLVNEFPTDPRPLAFRAHLRIRSGDYEEAIRDLSKGIEIDDKDPGLYLSRGDCLMRGGKVEMAVPDFTRGSNCPTNYGTIGTQRLSYSSGRKRT